MLARQRQTEEAVAALRVREKPETRLDEARMSFGSDSGQILEVTLLDEKSEEANAFLCGSLITVRVGARFGEDVRRPNVSIILREERGYNVYGTSSAMQGEALELDDDGRVSVDFSFSPQLRGGSYSLVVSLDDFLTPEVHTLLDRQVGVGVFQVIEGVSPFLGIVDLGAVVVSSHPPTEPTDR
jgi:lipopolysaccharide transport system ATP-binding protein